MGKRSVDRQADARIAIVGAALPATEAVREAVARLGVPGNRVNLYGVTRGEAVISDYRGEARLVQEPDIDEIIRHDVVFLCEPGVEADRIAGMRSAGSVVIDLSGGSSSGDLDALVHMDVNPDRVRDHGGLLVVPHPLTMLLVETLLPLDREFGITDTVAVVYRPVADFGSLAVDELRKQVVGALSFSEVPVETFGRPLAFNLVPQSDLACGTTGLDSRIADEVSRLLGRAREEISLRLLATPVFYGHALQVRLRLGRQAGLEQVRDAFYRGGYFVPAGDGSPATPLEVSIERTANVAELSDDGSGGVWIWAVAGDGDGKAADQAIRLARSLHDL